MAKFFSRLLSSAEVNDPKFERIVRNILIFTVIGTFGGLVLSSGILGNQPRFSTIATLVVAVLVELVAFWFLLRGNATPAIFIVPYALIIAISVIAINAGGVHDNVMIALPLVIIIAFLMQGNLAIYTTTPMVVLGYIVIGIFDITGLNPDPMAAETGFDDLAIGTLLIIIASTSLRLLTERVNDSVIEARRNEQAQIEANRELRELQASLEQRVEERTAELESSNRQTQIRASQLEAISDISRSLALFQGLEELLPEITKLISERFNFYHVGIFLLDDKKEYAVLRAANSTGGKRMLERQHKLKVESSSLVGYASIQKQARIALDVGDDAVYFSNPDLPDTHSEIALPMMIGDRVIGVLDVQSTNTNAFSQDDVQILNTLANQVAIAIENARLFSESRQSVEAAEKIYKQFIAQGWQRTARSAPNVGYRFSGDQLDALAKPLSTAEIKKAAEQGELVVVEDKKKSAMAVPIKVRDQVIGMLNVRSRESGYQWDEEELTLVQSLADRVSLALENARLLADAQRRAAKERAIGQISDKISAANSIDGILQTALLELGKTVNASKLTIELTPPGENTDS